LTGGTNRENKRGRTGGEPIRPTIVELVSDDWIDGPHIPSPIPRSKQTPVVTKSDDRHR